MQRRTAVILTLAVVGAAALAVATLRPPAVAPIEVAPTPVVAPAPSPRPADAPTAADLRVQVEVRLRERLLPPPSPRVEVLDVVDHGMPLPARVLAGVGVGAADDASAAGAALVAVAHTIPGELLRQANVPAGGTAQLRVGGRRLVRGRVLGPDGAPAFGAHVWLGESNAEGRREFVTDADGRYEADVPSGYGVPFVVQAPGCATQARVLDIGEGAVADARLAAGCALTVQVVAIAEAMDAARVFVLPTAEVGSDVAQWPFWLQALAGGAVVAAEGAVIDGLPRNAEIAVVVAHPLAPRMAPQTTRLKGDRPRAVVALPAFLPRRLAGRVVDADGQPLAGAEVEVGAASPRSRALAPRLAPDAAVARGVVAATSAADGGFLVGVSAGDDLVVRVRAAGHAGRAVPMRELVDGAAIALPPWRGGEPRFVLLPPRAGVAWAAQADLAGGIAAELAADAPWAVSLPEPGRYDFVCTTTEPGREPIRHVLADVVVTGPATLAPQPPR